MRENLMKAHRHFLSHMAALIPAVPGQEAGRAAGIGETGPGARTLLCLGK